MRFSPVRQPRVVLYSRAGCHLCEEAEAHVRRIAPDLPVVDIDTDPALTARYTVRVPVVEVDGREVAELQVDPAAVRAAVRAARRA